MTPREQAIETIGELYPADSDHWATRVIGLALLERARHEAIDWRTEPDPVLIRYAELCQEHAHTEQASARRNAERGI